MSHYIVEVNVRKVTRPGNNPQTAAMRQQQAQASRSNVLVARVVVSAPTIESARAKAQAHVELIEDGGEIE